MEFIDRIKILDFLRTPSRIAINIDYLFYNKILNDNFFENPSKLNYDNAKKLEEIIFNEYKNLFYKEFYEKFPTKKELLEYFEIYRNEDLYIWMANTLPLRLEHRKDYNVK